MLGIPGEAVSNDGWGLNATRHCFDSYLATMDINQTGICMETKTCKATAGMRPWLRQTAVLAASS